MKTLSFALIVAAFLNVASALAEDDPLATAAGDSLIAVSDLDREIEAHKDLRDSAAQRFPQGRLEAAGVYGTVLGASAATAGGTVLVAEKAVRASLYARQPKVAAQTAGLRRVARYGALIGLGVGAVSAGAATWERIQRERETLEAQMVNERAIQKLLERRTRSRPEAVVLESNSAGLKRAPAMELVPAPADRDAELAQ